ncbi:hypothetical protein [Psychrilyobacter atlanticus]|uniref:hypothetical protein n=1 Tax=Psychrilyobacter atlanticus TaxID=271091 RepID=UPI0004101822|nr:hypothetical protein [Psychrilyobacter atlanticus]
MKKIKFLMILLISLIFISCGNLEPYKKIVSVEDKTTENIRVTTYEDGSIRVEDLDFIKIKERQERENKKSDRRERGL